MVRPVNPLRSPRLPHAPRAVERGKRPIQHHEIAQLAMEVLSLVATTTNSPSGALMTLATAMKSLTARMLDMKFKQEVIDEIMTQASMLSEIVERKRNEQKSDQKPRLPPLVDVAGVPLEQEGSSLVDVDGKALVGEEQTND